jgi:hypothetical protein
VRGKKTGKELASRLRLNREAQINGAFDHVGADVATQALRSGQAGLASTAGGLAKARAQAQLQLMGNPEIEGMQMAQEYNQNDTNNTANLYSTMASRAANIDNSSYNPSSVAQNAGSALAAARGLASSSSAAGASWHWYCCWWPTGDCYS